MGKGRIGGCDDKVGQGLRKRVAQQGQGSAPRAHTMQQDDKAGRAQGRSSGRWAKGVSGGWPDLR